MIMLCDGALGVVEPNKNPLHVWKSQVEDVRLLDATYDVSMCSWVAGSMSSALEREVESL